MPIDHIERRERAAAICRSFPEAIQSGEERLAFHIRNRAFAFYLNNEFGDGKIALSCKGTPADQDFLMQLGAERFYIPAVVGPQGWIAVRLDLPEVDWEEVYDLAATGYRMVAPKKLLALLDDPQREQPDGLTKPV